MNGTSQAARIRVARPKISVWDDNSDSIVRLEEIWKEHGFQTQTFDDDLSGGEMLEELLQNRAAQSVIPAIDIMFPNRIKLSVQGRMFQVRDPQSAGFEILEYLASEFPELHTYGFLLISSGEMDERNLQRLARLRDRVPKLRFISKREPEASVLEKTYDIIPDENKRALFGYVRMFESFSDLLGLTEEERLRVIGAVVPSYDDVPYSRYLRSYIEVSEDARARISTLMAIEMILRGLYREDNIPAAMSRLRSHSNESLKQMLLSGDRLKQEHVRHMLEAMVGGGV